MTRAVVALALVGALVVMAASAARAEGEERRPPDIVVFVIDTLRADRMGVYGGPRPTTPNIDALAAEAVVFEQANAAAPWTLPSVVSLMTSTFPCEHGVRVDGQRLRDDIVPLAERLQHAGYETFSYVANGYASKASGLDRGFDHRAILPRILGQTLERWFRPAPDRPFFLYLHDIRPHNPYQADVKPLGEEELAPEVRAELNRRVQRYRRLTKVDFDAGREVGSTDNGKKQQRAMSWLAKHQEQFELLYAAEIRAADEVVGAVLAELRRQGRWENTLFVLTSDHGEEFDDHGGWQHDQSLYQELIRVPLIVRLPGSESAGRRDSTPVSLVDLIPTLADLLERPEIARDARGRSRLTNLRAVESPSAVHAPQVVAERHNQKKYYAPFVAHRGQRNVALRDGSWKGIWNVQPDTLELYDLTNDPEEKRDRSAERPDRANAMRQAAREWLKECSASARPVPTAPIDDADLQQLRALGYVD